MRELNRQRHQFRRLVAGKAEHEPLIARAARVNSHRDVRRLAMHGRQHRASVAVKSILRAVVANLAHRLARNLGIINQRLSRNLAGENHHAGCQQRLASHAAQRVLRQHRIQNSVRYLIRDFVRMSLGDRFRRKQNPSMIVTTQLKLLLIETQPLSQRSCQLKDRKR